jgi:hypothetical protein
MTRTQNFCRLPKGSPRSVSGLGTGCFASLQRGGRAFRGALEGRERKVVEQNFRTMRKFGRPREGKQSIPSLSPTHF